MNKQICICCTNFCDGGQMNNKPQFIIDNLVVDTNTDYEYSGNIPLIAKYGMLLEVYYQMGLT